MSEALVRPESSDNRRWPESYTNITLLPGRSSFPGVLERSETRVSQSRRGCLMALTRGSRNAVAVFIRLEHTLPRNPTIVGSPWRQQTTVTVTVTVQILKLPLKGNTTSKSNRDIFLVSKTAVMVIYRAFETVFVGIFRLKVTRKKSLISIIKRVFHLRNIFSFSCFSHKAIYFKF